MPTPGLSRRPRRGRRLPAGLRNLLWLGPTKGRKRKPGKDPDEGGVPVEPDTPRNLTGGAAAELDFEND